VDSLDLVVFMMAVEDEFEVEFTREDQKKMRTLGDVAANIAKSGNGADPRRIEN